MKGITVSGDGAYAEFQPGLTSGELLRALWAQGKETVTGSCLCAGIMGIMLGGGHGYLQGLYGFPTDQILEMRVVLANGTLAVASAEENEDLFWGLRGAGHNFGIVTLTRYKVYPSGPKWSQARLVFPGSHLEQIFTLSNDYLSIDSHPAGLILWYVFSRRPDLAQEPVIVMDLIYRGDLAELENLSSRFIALGALEVSMYTEIEYPDLYKLNTIDETSVVCKKGAYRHLFRSYLKRHSPEALRAVYNIFSNVITRTPVWTYYNESYAADILSATQDMKRIIVESSGEGQQNSYVNYAVGDETLAEIYGSAPWRVEKLKRLKSQYDPQGKFNFYLPLA
ncbi:unnamed protein product [Parascedosporium putredinis]|uniref:FAD-binding PCMH-type domain-containing protein n=1 Tax=Parascedosporium putredinis TaxID=1442378 RepID=A0A9P1H9F5_9PEZI|nr:unnamed protein product [Parascedosporium putredinis]CAI8001696.1 unnamed protein product [Parascedosporium putredinis]